MTAARKITIDVWGSTVLAHPFSAGHAWRMRFGKLGSTNDPWAEPRRAVLREAGRRAAHHAIQEVANLHEATIEFAETDGDNNAHAELCGRVIVFDPIWVGRVVEATGLDGARAIFFHEAGHLVDCRSNTDPRDRERFADFYAGQLLFQVGRPRGAGLAFFRRFTACGRFCFPHQDWDLRVRDVLAGWDAAARAEAVRAMQARTQQIQLQRKQQSVWWIP